MLSVPAYPRWWTRSGRALALLAVLSFAGGVDAAIIFTPADNSAHTVTAGASGLALAVEARSDNPLVKSITLKALSLPAGAAFTNSTTSSGTLSWNPTPAQVSATPYQASLQADSILDGSQVLHLAITVNDRPLALDDDNRAIVGPSLDIPSGGTVTLDVLANDQDKVGGLASAVLAITGAPAHGTVSKISGSSGTTLLIYHHDGSPGTSDSFSYMLTDVYGAVSAVATVNLTIQPANSTNLAPVLAPLADISVAEGQTRSIALAATDANAGDKLSFQLSAPAAAQGFVSLRDHQDGTAELSVAPDYNNSGVYSLTVTVADSASPPAHDSKVFTLTVSDVNRPPGLGGLAAGMQINAARGRLLSVPFTLSDPDGSTGLRVTSSGFPGFVSLAQSDATHYQLQINPGATVTTGNYGPLTLTVSDSGNPVLSTAITFNIMVQAYSHRWLGSASTAWNVAANWQAPGPAGSQGVPGAQDDVLLAAAVNLPRLDADAAVDDLWIENDGGLSLPAATLTVSGNLDASGGISGSGTVVLSGAATGLRGTLAALTVQGDVSLQGPTRVDGALRLRGGGRLRLGAQALRVAGDFTVSDDAALLMQDANGTLRIDGTATFAGASTEGLLSNGVLTLGGDFLQDNSGSGAGAAFRPGSNHRTVLAGTRPQRIAFANAGNNAGSSMFRHLEVANLAGVQFAGNGRITGNLLNRGSLQLTAASTLSLAGSFDNQLGATLGGSGTLDMGGASFTNNGRIAPGAPLGRLTLLAAVTLSGSSEVALELGGSTAGSNYDQLQASSLVLGGMLSAVASNGYTFSATDVFLAVNGSSGVSGKFTTHNLPPLAAQLDWRLDYGAQSLTLRVQDANAALVVNVDSDAADDSRCDRSHCSLRGAITQANLAAGADRIVFDIAPPGAHTITLAQALPEISDRLVIDAATQPGAFAAATRHITLHGALAGQADGLVLRAGSSRVRGFAINGFAGNGIVVRGSGGNVIEDNFIGTDAAGNDARPNRGAGLLIDNVAGNRVGAGNVIAGNGGDGILISGVYALANSIIGNRIGLAAGDDRPLGNAGHGIRVQDASDNLLGDDPAGTANYIAYNGGSGIAVLTGGGNRLLANSIHDNAGLGIDLGVSGITANDSMDTDGGANGLQNGPRLGAATAGSNSISGVLDSAPDQEYALHFYQSAQCDGSGSGEGAQYLGKVSVLTDAAGSGTFTAQQLQAPLQSGQVVTATATGGEGTSEFSACVTVVEAPPDLALSMHAVGNFSVGASAGYLLEVRNLGAGASRGPITVTVTLPVGLSYAGGGGNDWQCAADGPVVSCVRTAVLAAGAGSQFSLGVTLSASAVPAVESVASVYTAGDGEPGNDGVALLTAVGLPGDGGAAGPTIRPDDIPVARVGVVYHTGFSLAGGVPPYTTLISATVPGIDILGAELAGIPQTAGDYPVTVNISDSAVPGHALQKDYVLRVTAATDGVTVATTAPEDATVGASYSFMLQALGGSAPYSWRSDDPLPPGIQLVSSGLLSGTPQRAGDYVFSVRVQDARHAGARRRLSLRVGAAGLRNLTPPLPAGLVGERYQVPLLISGGSGAYTCSVVSGQLPPGLARAAAGGCGIQGIPRERGDYSFQLRVEDNGSPPLRGEFPAAIRILSADDLAESVPRLQRRADASSRISRLAGELGAASPGDGFPDENLQDMTADAYGNRYVAGYAYSGGRYVAHLVKFAADGRRLWHQVVTAGTHSYGYGVTVAPDQSVYLAGYLLQGNVYRGLLVKFDSSGERLWQQTYGVSRGRSDAFYKLTANADAVYAVGESHNGRQFDALVAKYDRDGNLLWAQRRHTGADTTAYAVVVSGCMDTPPCRVLVAGADGDGLGWLQALAAEDGAWQTELEWRAEYRVEDLALAEQGDVIIAGTDSQGTWRLDRLDGAFLPRWPAGMALADEDKSATGGRLRAIALDREGYLYAVGYVDTAAGRELQIVVLDSDGEKIDSLRPDAGELQLADQQRAEGRALVIDANQNLVVCGQATGGGGASFLLLDIDTGKGFQ